MISGVFLSIGMTPFDVVATRLFNQGLLFSCSNFHSIPLGIINEIIFLGVDQNGKGLLYRNVFDCFVKTFKIEGIRGLYKGFIANYCRCAPHTILNLTFWDIFKKWKDIYLSDEANIFFE